MSEHVASFFELIADSSVFEAAFKRAKAQAGEFAAGFKVAATSVEADASKMGIAIERGIATGSLSRQGANRMIAQRLAFYGDTRQAGPAAGAAGTAGGLSLAAGLGGIYAAAAGIGVLTSVLALTDRLVKEQAAYSSEILRNSQALGMNAQQLQTWDKIAQTTGIDQHSLVLDFERFARNLQEGAPALKATGLTLKDIGITTTDTGKALLQAADWFHTHRDAAQQAAVAQALFGRSGSELIPILSQGSAAVQKYQAQLQAMGVLLSNSDLIAGARAQASLTQMTNAFEAAKSQLTTAALPGFTAFFNTLTVILEQNASTWVAIGNAIGNVVLFISGLVAGFAGVDLKDILTPPADAGAAYEGLGAGASGAAAGIDKAAAAAQRATQAIDDQIAALRDQKRAQDEVYDAQKQSLQDQLDTLHDVTDTRRHQGEDLVSYERRLEELGLQDKIKAVDKQKSVYDRQVDDHIASLEKERRAVQAAANAMADDLSAGMSKGMAGLNTSLAAGMSKAQKNVLATAHQMGEDIKEIFTDKDGKMGQAAERLGKTLGAAFLNGLQDYIVSQGENSLIPGVGAVADTYDFVKWLISHIPHAASGGITSGPTLAGESGTEVVLPYNNPRRSLALMEQSGMATLARAAATGTAGAGIATFVVNFNGPVATEMVANQVMTKIDREMRKRGFNNSRGFGTG